MWVFKTKYGFFKIVPKKGGWVDLWIDDELLGNYPSSDSAADDVFTKHTGNYDWDEDEQVDPPYDLSEWSWIQ